MHFIIARAARITGGMLEQAVREQLREAHIPEPDCVICYGAGYNGQLPALNANCSDMNKMDQGIALETGLGAEALRIIPILQDRHPMQTYPLPLVARKIRHSKGRDMRVCRTLKSVRACLARGRHHFFTPIVPSDTEYRVWVYRKRVLSVYEKRLTEPENNVKFGRNRANGWTFHALDTENIPDSVRRVAVAAVRCLHLDFGAVDVLGTRRGTEMHPTVLEVNSAPGVSDEHRTAFVKLAHRIVRWIANGCPARERDEV